MKLTFQILFITLLLSACSNVPVQNTTLPTITPTATFQNAVTPQPTSTPTIPATETPVSKEVIAITATHEAELSVEATVAALGTICQPPARDYFVKMSPDGQWIAMECEGVDGGVDSYLQVVSLQGNKKWSIHYADYAKGTYYDRNNMIRPAHWSKDGKYLYVTSEDTGSGCCWIGWDVLIVRLNLENGQQTTIANTIGETDMNISFSSSERYMLYIPQDGKNNLYIWDTETAKQKVVNLEDTHAGAGHTLMSDDTQKIILILRDYPKENQGDTTDASLVIVDLKSGLQKKLLSDIGYEKIPIPVHWQDNDHVFVEKDNELLLLNINTGELIGAVKP
jgi:WD40 repeat protein